LKHSPELQCELQSQHSRLQVALPARVLVLVARQALVQVARLVLVARLALVQVPRLVQALVRALAEHLPHLLLRQLQSRCQLELCRLL
jgi:hypothetical protein